MWRRRPPKAGLKRKPRHANRRSARCPSGTWPTFMPVSTIRRSSAISIGPTPKAWHSRRPIRASSTIWRAAPDAGAALGEAVRRYEAIDDLMGRLGSYAGLMHAGNTVDPARTKFYGDVQERLTAASTHLLFFTLELNRIDDALLRSGDGRSGARPLPAVARRRAPLQALSARGPRRAIVSRKIGDRPIRPGTGMFDATIANLRFKVGGKSLAIEPTLNLLAGPLRRKAQSRGAGAGARPSRRMCSSSR